MNNEQFNAAIEAFDSYNANDPNKETVQGEIFPKELLYAQRMTTRLNSYAPNASEAVQLAARCQHIGRWEIARSQYPMDKKGYLQWRNALKQLHVIIASPILVKCSYDANTIDQVKNLLLKNELTHNAETQLLEDMVCLVFIEFYLEEFSQKHDDEKVIDILQKTMKKMTARALQVATEIPLNNQLKFLIREALIKR